MEKKNYIDEVKFYLETNTNLKIRKEKGNWLKIEDSDIILYVNASKLYTESKPYYGWYDLSENTYNDILNNTSTNFFNLILLKDMSTIFLIPRSDFLKIFDKKYMTKPHEWMFNIFIEDGKYILKFTNESGQHEITNYLNRWEEILRLISNIQEVKNQDQELLANESPCNFLISV